MISHINADDYIPAVLCFTPKGHIMYLHKLFSDVTCARLKVEKIKQSGFDTATDAADRIYTKHAVYTKKIQRRYENLKKCEGLCENCLGKLFLLI